MVADDAYDPTKTVDATVKMIGEDEVFARLGFGGVPTTQAVLPILKDTHVPLAGLRAGSAAVRRRVNHHVSNIRAGIEQATQNRGLTHAAIDSLQKGTRAVETGLTAILAANPEVVIMAGPAAPPAAFAKRARADGLKFDMSNGGHQALAGVLVTKVEGGQIASLR